MTLPVHIPLTACMFPSGLFVTSGTLFLWVIDHFDSPTCISLLTAILKDILGLLGHLRLII